MLFMFGRLPAPIIDINFFADPCMPVLICRCSWPRIWPCRTGAMENKSLNIFNSRLVLASPDTATDMDYERIEGVVGHE